ncbi:MAG: endonuclease/exonuclease/phosphatase family protein [Verrucomicrobiae bacterium]|nr:endonuclease/exonuclease/phosphatase family protein [Verrucomicrobiae bacterium]
MKPPACILLLAVLLAASSAQALILGTFNIRYANPGDVERGNGWEQRAPVVTDLIRFHNFDVIGIQEALHHQLLTMAERMPEYAYTGRGRDDGRHRGEHAAIFYKKGKFRLLDGGDFWFSETPDVPGRGWDAALPRICTWVKLQPVSGTRPFHLFNLHFDHVGVQARLESARLVLRRIHEIAGDQPVVLVGDFNVDQNSEGYRILTGSGVFTDAHDTAAIRYALNGTANRFDPNTRTDSRIDHIFLTRHFQALRYGVLTDSYRIRVPQPGPDAPSGNFPREIRFGEFQARLPSDHFPVLVEVSALPSDP